MRRGDARVPALPWRWRSTGLAAIAMHGAAGAAPPVSAALRSLDPPAAIGALAPNVSTAADGVLLSWLEPAPTAGGESAGERRRLRFARLVDGRWSAPADVVERDDFFANWADLPSIVPGQDGSLLAHWLQSSGEDVYAYDVVVARSVDAGRTWHTLGPAHSDGTETEHGFASLVPEGGAFRAFWLDGREMAKPGGGDDSDARHGHGTGNMTLRTAPIGASVGDAVVLDDRVCECCDTSAAVTSRGPVIAYRDRGADEVRDVFIVRRVDGGWTAPRPVHDDGWRIAGCPVNGPAVDARDDVVVVAWFTAPDAAAAVRAAFSTDGGAHFGAPITVDDTAPQGRVDVVLLPSGEAVASYLDGERSGGAITLRRLAPDGRAGRAMTVAKTSVARASGFPKIAVAGADLLVVWREVAKQPRIRAATIPLAAIPAVQTPGG